MTAIAEPPRATTRATDATRRALIEAATNIFAEHGYERGSVRLITSAAGANQAAITYHFGGKDGLYREVLRAAIRAFEDQSLVDETTPETASAEEALRLLVRQLLVPLVKRDRLSRYMRIFAWESAEPSPVFAEFMARETPPVFRITERIVRRFLPDDAAPEEVALTVFWVIEQPIAIVRNAERLAGPPFNLPLEGAHAVDAIVDKVTRLCLGGLASRRPEGASV
jgi:AcrR family transcriptional regulator